MNDVWRPESSSIMLQIGNKEFFNAPSREAIVKRIMELRNLEYNFDDFLEVDQISIGKIQTRLSSRQLNSLENKIDCVQRHFLE